MLNNEQKKSYLQCIDFQLMNLNISIRMGQLFLLFLYEDELGITFLNDNNIFYIRTNTRHTSLHNGICLYAKVSYFGAFVTYFCLCKLSILQIFFVCFLFRCEPIMTFRLLPITKLSSKKLFIQILPASDNYRSVNNWKYL